MRSPKALACWSLLAIVVWVFPPLMQTAQGQARAILFEGARLITGDGSTPIENSAFVVENGRITQVGNRGLLKAPSGAASVDLSGKTVIPAMIDGHNHIGYQDYKNLRWGCDVGPCRNTNFRRENILDHMERGAYNGVGAIWSAGYDFGDMPYELRDEIFAGKHPNAARYLPSGPGFTTPDTITVPLGRQNGYGVSTEDEVRWAVEEMAAKNVLVLKAWVQGGGGEDQGGKGSRIALAPNLYTALFNEAHKHGMKVHVHAHESREASGLIRAGIDGFGHQIGDQAVDDFTISDEALAALKEAGPKVFMVLTMGGPPGAGHDAAFKDPPALLRDTANPTKLKQLMANAAKPRDPTANQRLMELFEKTKTRIRQYMDAGIRIGLGSDAGGVGMGANIIGWSVHIEMEEMALGGMTPSQVITAATKTNAEFFGLDDMGTLAPGKSADFVVLDANPLDDIKNTRQISRVYLRGNEVDRAALRAKWRAWWGMTK